MSWRRGTRNHLGGFVAALAMVTVIGCDDSGDPAGSGVLVINEVMPRNTTVITDEEGEFDDWFEIYNPSSQDVDLGGFFASDSVDDPYRAELPAGLVVPGRGVLLMWCDNDVEQGSNHLPFKLKGEGEEVLLSNEEGILSDRVEFGDLAEDLSLARIPDGDGEPVSCDAPTPGELNGNSCN